MVTSERHSGLLINPYSGGPVSNLESNTVFSAEIFCVLSRGLPSCDAVQCCGRIPTFQKPLLLLSSLYFTLKMEAAWTFEAYSCLKV